MTAVDSAPPAAAANAKTEEERIADLVTALFPLQLDGKPSELGQKVFTLVVDEIARERTRCVEIVQAVGASAERMTAHLGAISQAARAEGNARQAVEADGGARQTYAVKKAAISIARALVLPPGTCPACSGTQRVRSTLNPAHTVPCESCKPKEEVRTP